jgi:aspartyl-tRNA(Asn)/glutamyl-tRNA(Gln) amidotransferase subunit C
MAIGEDEVARIAHLARLQVPEEDVPGYAVELSGILDFVAQMDAVDASGVTPMAHPLDGAQRLREDRVSEPDRRSEHQRGAPAVENGLYLVPKVIE